MLKKTKTTHDLTYCKRCKYLIQYPFILLTVVQEAFKSNLLFIFKNNFYNPFLPVICGRKNKQHKYTDIYF